MDTITAILVPSGEGDVKLCEALRDLAVHKIFLLKLIEIARSFV